MENILFVYDEDLEEHKFDFLKSLSEGLGEESYAILSATTLIDAYTILKSNPRICSLILDWDHFDLSAFSKIAEYNPKLPIFTVSETHRDTDLRLKDFDLNLDFIQYDALPVEDNLQRITKAIGQYFYKILPPFTKELMHYVEENNYSFCTPGHQQGYGFQKSPVGTVFYDFYGPNIFKSDISISMGELGSLLDHSGPHKDAENFIADVFGSDRSLIVTNGTSTSNKIVGMCSATDGDTILVDRNCHKSLAQLMMMVDVIPIYLNPTRNAYGILGGIPLAEFSKKSIQKKLKAHPKAKSWPTYAVVTNSTYDGVFYNVEKIHKDLDVKHLHFDSAWVPYTNFHPIYKEKYGMGIKKIKPGHAIFETQSTHKLLAAFSQASMIHAKGDYDEEALNESFMMHTSTSPFYPLVASCEISAAMMKDKMGEALIQDCITQAMDFRKEMTSLKKQSKTWFYEIWQPANIDKTQCWPIDQKSKWHGFNNADNDYLYLDPVKVTVLLPGIKNEKLQKEGIPAAIVAAFLESHEIIVEKTGPYSMLFLFSVGITKAKAMNLVHKLNKFKQMYDQNLTIKEILPNIYEQHPQLYKNKRIQEISGLLHKTIVKHNLPKVMYHAFDHLPEFVMTPHRAYQKLIKGKTKKIPLDKLQGHTSAVMILPYPPGIPVIMPGERIDKKSQVILEYLLMLEDIGQTLPGFEIDIHGVERGEDNKLYVKVLF
jgi:lysine decarboxylase